MARLRLTTLGTCCLLFLVGALGAQDRPKDPALEVFEAVGSALREPAAITAERRAALIQSVGRLTGSAEALARLAENPSVGMGAELSAGGQPAGWFVAPSLQYGVEGDKGNAGVTVKPPGKFGNLSSVQMRFKPEDEKPSIAFVFTGAVELKDGVTYQRQYSMEFQYKDKYAYMSALGVDARNLPGTRTTLWAMDQIIGAKTTPAVLNPSSTGNMTVMKAVTNELRELMPPIFEAQQKFERVTIGSGYSITIDSKEFAARGVKTAGSIRIGSMDMERIEAGQRSGEGVKFTERSIGVAFGGKWAPQPDNFLAPRAEAEVGAAFTYSDDPEKKLEKVSASRAEMAAMFRDGRMSEAFAKTLGHMAPVVKADTVQSVMEKVRSSLEAENPNGVKIRIDDRMLAEALNAGTLDEASRVLEDLGRKLSNAKNEAAQRDVLQAFTASIKRRFRTNRKLEQVEGLTLVSLQALAREAESYEKNWETLPAKLRAPGITRIVGFVVDNANYDVLLVGSVTPGAPPIEIDDLVVGLRAVWREGSTPLVSLDPDPDDPGGPQRARVQGVPRDSQFALTMLEADYLMKKIMGSMEPAPAAGYVSLKQILARDRPAEFMNRFWLYPVQPEPGDIQVASDGRAALFRSGVQTLSEQMVRTREGLAGAGRTMRSAEEAAIEFTRHYPEIAKRAPVYAKLQGLFDIVLLARVLRSMQVDSPALGRVADLPYRTVEVPQSYAGVRYPVYEERGETFFIQGGVQAKIGAGSSTWLVLDDPELTALRERTRVIAASGGVTGSASGLAIRVAEPDRSRRDTASLTLTTALVKLNNGDTGGALQEVSQLVRMRPFDAEPIALRALIHFNRGDWAGARRDARMARGMEPADPSLVMLTSTILFQCDALEGKTESALQEIEFGLKQDPASVNARIFRANALFVVNRVDDARAELKDAIALNPASALAYTRLGLLELSEGWTTTGQKWIRKAEALSPGEADNPALKAALAMAEVAAAAQGNAKTRLAKASRLAREAMARPNCDPESRMLSLTVLSIAALAEEDWRTAEGHLTSIQAMLPNSPYALLMLAEFAHEAKRDDLAERHLAEAERLAPGSPMVQSTRKKLGK
jgi:Flp pilus assembly protein TadD